MEYICFREHIFQAYLFLSINSFSIFSTSLNKFCLKSRVIYCGWHLGVCNLRLGFYSIGLPHKGSVKCLFVLRTAQSLWATTRTIKVGNLANQCRYKWTSMFDGPASPWGFVKLRTQSWKFLKVLLYLNAKNNRVVKYLWNVLYLGFYCFTFFKIACRNPWFILLQYLVFDSE